MFAFGDGCGVCLRRDRKLVRLGLDGDWELFDLHWDRTEQHNLAGSHPDEVEALAKQWREWARSSNVIPRPAPKPKKQQKQPSKKRSNEP